MYVANALASNACVLCRWCTMRAGALAATAANILLLTFFILQSFQSPFGKRHLAQINRMMDMQRQALMAAEEHFKLGNPSAESYFKLWIKKDLATWSQDGISEVSTLTYILPYGLELALNFPDYLNSCVLQPCSTIVCFVVITLSSPIRFIDMFLQPVDLTQFFS